MREFCDNLLLPSYSKSNLIENKQAAINGMETPSFHSRMYTFSSSLFQPHAILWFFRRLADVAMIEKQALQPHGVGGRSMGPSRSMPLYALCSQRGGVRFCLRRRAFIVPLGTARDGFLVTGPGCREAAAIVGATVAL